MKFEVSSFGSNGSGQLATGNTEDVSTPTRCLFASGALLTSRPVQLVAGGNHTLMRCEDGSVYAAGNNTDGRCGIEPAPECLTTFRHVGISGPDGQRIDRFKSVAATWEASLFVTLDDKVYVCGSGARGELGLGLEHKQAYPPRLLTGGALYSVRGSILDVAACMGHFVLAFSTKEVVGWGGGRKGQLGSTPLTATPVQIVRSNPNSSAKSLQVCSRVVCGQEFTCLLASPEHGQLQILGSDKHNVRSSAPLDSSAGWRQVEASWGSIFVLLEGGELMSWGRNDHGQLGSSDLPPLRAIAAGSEHVLAETSDGKIIAWGWGEHGNCGYFTDGEADVKGTWNEIGSGHVLGAGCATSWIYTEEDR